MSESLKYAIIAKNVSFDYRKQKQKKKSLVLNSVNINVARGEIYGILGPSGCGKTTLLKLVIGLREPSNGHISVFGYKPGSIESGTPGIGVGYMPQEISLPDHMTINEVFKYFGNLYLLADELIDTKMRCFSKTLHLNNEKALICNLSGGEKRLVSLAIALFSSPRLIILDEPTVGIDPLLRQTIWSFLTRLTLESNTTIIVTTHYIEEMRCAQKVAFMRKGEILEETEPYKAINHYNCLNLESAFLALCVKQKEYNQSLTSKSNYFNGTNRETVKQSNISIVEPLKDERRNRNRFKNETRIIRAVILKSFYYYWRIGGFILACFCSFYGIFLCIYCIGNNPSDVPIGWIVDDLPINNTLTEGINRIPYLPDLFLKSIDKKVINIIKYETVDTAVEDARKRKIMGYIHLKQNFSESFYKRDVILIDDTDYISNETIDSGTVHLYLDATNLMLQQLIFRELFETVMKFRQKAFMEIGIDTNVSEFPFKLAEPIHGTTVSEHLTQYTKNSAIIFVVLICFILSMTLSALSVAADINSDVYSRSFSAGLKPHQLIIGEIISRCLFMSSTAALSFIAIIYVFHVTLKGSLFFAIINLLLTILCGVCLGALFAVVIKKIFFCHIIILAISIATIVISGGVWPVEAQPYFIKAVVPFLPNILPVFAMLKIFNYKYTDFATHILLAFLSSAFYSITSSVATFYFLRKLAV